MNSPKISQKGSHMHQPSAQPLILSGNKPCGLSLTYRHLPERNAKKVLQNLSQHFDPQKGIIGLGEPLVSAFSRKVPGLRTFPGLSGANCSSPSTQGSLWIFLQGNDRSEIFDQLLPLSDILNDSFSPDDQIDTFLYAGGKDLSGYEDGTENPSGEKALDVAIATEREGVAGSSLVAVQRWVHDLKHFRTHSQNERDNIIGRKQATNEEILDADPSAHVKRSAQESYTPPAYMLRRSMPWALNLEQGLEFIAFGKTLDPFEHVLRRMMGLDDGIADALFTFSRSVRGGYYWCPPIMGDRLDLRFLFD